MHHHKSSHIVWNLEQYALHHDSYSPTCTNLVKANSTLFALKCNICLWREVTTSTCLWGQECSWASKFRRTTSEHSTDLVKLLPLQSTCQHVRKNVLAIQTVIEKAYENLIITPDQPKVDVSILVDCLK
jgi:hypothetical protein